ncbi:MAG: FliH/SctL family protein [Fidelibacterota bacterium]
MTQIRIPLKSKVKGIQGSNNQQQKKNSATLKSPETDENKPLQLNLSTHHKDLQKENNDLRKRVEILEQSLQQAREETFLSGIDEGKEQLRHELESQVYQEVESLRTVVNTVREDFTKELKKLHPHVVKLGRIIAEKILNAELQNEDRYNDILLEQISRILHELIDQETITIHVSSSQIEWIMNKNLEKEFHLPGSLKVKFYEDRKLKPGECILESTNLLVEGKFAQQLDNIESQLLNS